MFDETELVYLRSQPLGRLATVDHEGQPDASPVAFEFDGEVFWIGGFDVPSTRKYKNVVGGNQKVAFVVDDLASVDPWRPRAIRIYGTAEAVEREGMFGPGTYLKITPTITWSIAIHQAFDGAGHSSSLERKVWS